MIRIVVSGMCPSEICNLATRLGKNQVEAVETLDINGALDVAQGKAEFYFGACATGAGGALAMAIAILGYDRCYTASTVGCPPNAVEIWQAVQNGKRAFGFSIDHIDTVVPILVDAILASLPH